MRVCEICKINLMLLWLLLSEVGVMKVNKMKLIVNKYILLIIVSFRVMLVLRILLGFRF